MSISSRRRFQGTVTLYLDIFMRGVEKSPLVADLLLTLKERDFGCKCTFIAAIEIKAIMMVFPEFSVTGLVVVLVLVLSLLLVLVLLV